MKKAFYRKSLIGYYGDYFTDAVIVKRNEKTVTIAVYNLRAGTFEKKHVKPEMVAERFDESAIDEMFAHACEPSPQSTCSVQK